MTRQATKPTGEVAARLITESGLSIYEPLNRDDPRYIETSELERRLDSRLQGLRLDYPIRTRAKVAKTAVCEALGYPLPGTFAKTQPRFPGQNIDVYVQKNDNLQIWNEEVSPDRRYILIRVDSRGEVVRVRVLTGEAVALLDRTGTLTSKFQARRRGDVVAEAPAALVVSPTDTAVFREVLQPRLSIEPEILKAISPVDFPRVGRVLTVASVCGRLASLVGEELPDPGLDQERNRGAELHRRVCAALSLGPYRDKGQFPDISCQALEVKLQTSPTIDLGLVSPDSRSPVEKLDGLIRHCDVRYAVFYGFRTRQHTVRLVSVIVSTGEDFFREFEKFGGLVQNRKLQIPLPKDLFV